MLLLANHRKLNLDPRQARVILQSFSPCPDGHSLVENNVVEPFKYDLQIIVPAYNVEKFLRECVDSILGQDTTYSYKVILIDDGSTDSTPQITDEYAKDTTVTVIHQKNKGFSGARNTGLNVIEARYIMFVDSDDLLTEGAVQALLDTAFEKDADIVEGGYYSLYEYENALIPEISASGINTMEKRTSLRGQPWGKVFKSELFRKIGFPEGFWFEDSINSFLVYPQSDRTYLIPDYVYKYRQQPNSISHTFTGRPKSIDTFWISELLMDEHEKLGLPKDYSYYEKILRQFLLNAKRVQKTPEEIQQSVFCLSRELLTKYFPKGFSSKENRGLDKAFRENDFGAYRLYCKLH